METTPGQGQPGGLGRGRVAAEARRGGGFGVGGGAFQKCLPDRFQRLRATITTPRETLRQVGRLRRRRTSRSTPYTIAGVDQRHPALALVTPTQVQPGSVPSHRPVAARRSSRPPTQRPTTSQVGSTLDLNGTHYRVVGLIEPPLGGQSADVYLPLAELQKLAGSGRVNVALVRADDSASVADVAKEHRRCVPERDCRELAAGRRHDQRVACRRGRSVEVARAGPLRRRRVPLRSSLRLSDVVVGRQARS